MLSYFRMDPQKKYLMLVQVSNSNIELYNSHRKKNVQGLPVSLALLLKKKKKCLTEGELKFLVVAFLFFFMSLFYPLGQSDNSPSSKKILLSSFRFKNRAFIIQIFSLYSESP